MTDDELKAHVRAQVMEFVGKPNTPETQEGIREMLLTLMTEHPHRLEVIAEVLLEGSTE